MHQQMTVRRFPRLTGLFSALAICGAGTIVAVQSDCRADQPGDKTYVIKLAHPMHVGDKYELSETSNRDIHSEVTVANNKPIIQDEKMALHLEATMEVLAVDSKSIPSKLSCTIKKFIHTDGKDAEILAPGAVVTAEANANPADQGSEKTRYSLKDGVLTRQQTAALGVVIEAHTPESATDDEIFGTDKQQKIGATWPMDVAKAVADAGRSKITIKPDGTKGEVTFEGAEKVGDVEYLRVKAHTIAVISSAPLPNGLKLADGARMEVELTGLFAPGGSAFTPAQTMKMDMEITANGNAPDGSPVTVHMTMKGNMDSKTSPVKP